MLDVFETLIKEEVKKAMEYCITAVTPMTLSKRRLGAYFVLYNIYTLINNFYSNFLYLLKYK